MHADPVVALLPVTQADRNFAADYGIRFGRFGELYRRAIEDGDWDQADDVQMVARHRLAHRTPAPAGDVREADDEDAKLLADANSWYSQAQIEEESWQVAERLLAKEEGLDPSHHAGAFNRLLDKQIVTKNGALSAIRKALASPTPDSSAVSGSAEGEPVAWCSPGQLANLTDIDADGGVYLPIRKTERGNFTMPLFATPKPPVDVAIWSGEHRAYWRRGSRGEGANYTLNLDEAGVWSRDDAIRLTSHCGPEKLIALHDRPNLAGDGACV